MDIKFAGMYTIKDSFSEVVEPGNRIGFNILEGTGMARHYVSAKVLSNPDPGSLQYIEGSYSTNTGEITVHNMIPMQEFVQNFLKSTVPDEIASLVAEYLNHYFQAVHYLIGDNFDPEVAGNGPGPITAATLYLQYRNFQMIFNIMSGRGELPDPEMNFDFFLDLFNPAMVMVVRMLEFGFRLVSVDPFSIQNKKVNKNPMDLWAASSGSTLGN